MSVLKIKDQNNNWTQIPTIKGDKGDPFTYADFTPEQLESLKGKDGISPTVSVASDTSEDYRLSFTDETHTVTTPNLIPEAEKILSVYPHDTASGAVASFPDGADNIPLKSCIVRVEPVQEGSGDPSPDNVRPISGWTGCEVQRTGKNLIDEDNVNVLNAYIANDKVATNANHCSVYIPCKPNTMYTMQKICVGSGDQDRFSIGYTVETPSNDAACYGIIHSTSASRVQGQMVSLSITTGQDAKYLICWISYSTGYADSIATFQLELGSTATPYEPYTGQTYPITFPSSAGTIYGGYVDVINGELVVDKGFATLNGSETWLEYPSYNGFYTDAVNMKYGVRQDGISNMLVNSKTGNSGQTNAMWLGVNSARLFVIGVYDSMGSTLDAFKAYLAEHPLQVTYPLATPIHYPITPTEITSLLGQNNVWADTGDVEVEYRASTKMYIDRKITEAVAAALNS